MSKRKTDSPKQKARLQQASFLPGINRLTEEDLATSQTFLDAMRARGVGSRSQRITATDEPPTDTIFCGLRKDRCARLAEAIEKEQSISALSEGGAHASLLESWAEQEHSIAVRKRFADAARSQDALNRRQRVEVLFELACLIWLEQLVPDISAFKTKIDEIWRAACEKFEIDHTMPSDRRVAWLERARLEAARATRENSERAARERTKETNDTPGKVQPRRRGRPTEISPEKKAAALAVKNKGGSNKEQAKKLYGTDYPTPQQVKNVPSIRRNYQKNMQQRKDLGPPE